MKVVSVVVVSLLLTVQSLYAAPVPANTNPQKPPVVAKTDKSVKINLNKADITTISHAFKGIGKKRAEAILEYRQNHPLKTVEELSNVKGFGKKFVSKNITKLQEVFSVS